MAPAEEDPPRRGNGEIASFDVEQLPGCVVVRAAGEIDIMTAPNLRDAAEVATQFSQLVIVDLTLVSILDSMGLQALLQARTRAHERGGRVVLVGPNGIVLKALTVTGLDEALPVYDNLSAAIAALTHANST